MERVEIIAEAGVNHNGSVQLGKELIDAAAAAGCDVVKFQTYKAELSIAPTARKARYQLNSTDAAEGQLEMSRKLELSTGETAELAEHARGANIAFASSPFDAPSADFLVNEVGVPFVKVPSGEITNAPLLLHLARLGSRLYMSTGMSTLADVEDALAVLAFGYARAPVASPGSVAFRKAYVSQAGQNALRERVTLLHCTSSYPADPESVNLTAIATLKRSFGLPVGYSDHTTGIDITTAAVATGAQVVEKHFTTSRALPGPDHSASLEPDELERMVRAIRRVEAALGVGVKLPNEDEVDNAERVRKSICAARPIPSGEAFSEENLAVKRPGEGLSPMRFWDLVGTRARRSYEKDEMIDRAAALN